MVRKATTATTFKKFVSKLQHWLGGTWFACLRSHNESAHISDCLNANTHTHTHDQHQLLPTRFAEASLKRNVDSLVLSVLSFINIILCSFLVPWIYQPLQWYSNGFVNWSYQRCSFATTNNTVGILAMQQTTDAIQRIMRKRNIDKNVLNAISTQTQKELQLLLLLSIFCFIFATFIFSYFDKFHFNRIRRLHVNMYVCVYFIRFVCSWASLKRFTNKRRKQTKS